MTKLVSINPSNKEKLGEVETSSINEIKEKVNKSHEAFREWGVMSVNERIGHLKKVISGFEKRKEEIASLASKEMGMPLNDSLADVDDSLVYFNWYLENAPKYLSEKVTHEDDKTIHKVFREPIGVVASITPWNYPTSNIVWATAQSLVSGNTVIYKTSEECPLFGKLMEEIMKTTLPEGVFEEVYGDGEVGKQLVESSIDLITFTGSTQTGKYLYKVASEKFIKVVLELGGSAPGIVFEDADIDITIENIFYNRYGNCGQTCDGLKRLIVHKDLAEKVIERLITRISNITIGDAFDRNTQLGPLVSEKQLEILKVQVSDAISKGAEVIVGGKQLDLGGYFYAPTILVNTKKDMLVWKEEVFGPVLPIVTFSTESQAIDLANDTKYGLGSYVYTRDLAKAERVASKIKTGMVSINGISYVNPYNPFGGCKLSGIGREHGEFGFEELTQIKIVSSNK